MQSAPPLVNCLSVCTADNAGGTLYEHFEVLVVVKSVNRRMCVTPKRATHQEGRVQTIRDRHAIATCRTQKESVATQGRNKQRVLYIRGADSQAGR